MTDVRTASQQTRQQPAPSTAARPYIGGQAVLEGVMMRAPHSFSIVVRRRDGSLLVRERAVPDERTGIRRWPLVRGVSSLVESLRLGSESLRFSVEQLEKDLAAEEAAELAKSKASTAGLSALAAFGLSLFSLLSADDGQAVASTDADAKKGGRGAMGVMLVFAIAFLIALPQAAAAGINRVFHLGLEVQSPLFQVITGALKLTVVVGYMLLIRRVPDIRRVFQYHGAEHKTISTYEANEELIVVNARAKTTLHPRCGTTFLVMVALVSILVFTAVGGLLPRIHTGSAIADNVLFFLEKLPFLPLIAAVTFEIQRLFARYCTTGPLRALLWPGFLVQKITTIEPDDDQLEVALASLRATLFREHGEVSEVADDVSFANYEALATASHLRS
ncbi:DUF1385 domain-containing protein [Pendulispora brunnea]|uniref:DUF1385 domain-containing protein n=1 Tax=Pendulispora brunnea TaxID=2905690 RepID=A0ABZ2KNH5_9BACT